MRRAIAALSVLALALVVPAASAVGSPGCAAAGEPVFASTSFTPVAGRLTSPMFPTFGSMGAVPAQTAAAATDFPGFVIPPGLTARFVIHFGQAAGSAMLVLSPGPLSADDTVVDLVRAGGLEIVRQPRGNGAAADVIAAVGPRAAPLKVGPYDGAIVHGDPIGSDDVRPYELHWSDGSNDFMIYGRLPAGDVIRTARSLYCH